MPIQIDGETYLNTTEACNQLGVSRETLNNYVNAGRINRYKRGIGRTSFYKQSDIDRLLVLRVDTVDEDTED